MKFKSLSELSLAWLTAKQDYIQAQKWLKDTIDSIQTKIEQECGQKISVPHYYNVGKIGWNHYDFHTVSTFTKEAEERAEGFHINEPYECSNGRQRCSQLNAHWMMSLNQLITLTNAIKALDVHQVESVILQMNNPE